MIDYTGIPNPYCPECGDNKFATWIVVDPDDYEIGMYATDGQCMECGTRYTIATPTEHPDNIEIELRGEENDEY